MHYKLRDEVYFCIANHQIVLLDLQADRYFCLPALADRAFRQVLNGTALDDIDAECLAPIVSRGLLLESESACQISSRPGITPPAKSILDSDLDRWSGFRTVEAIALRALTSSELRQRPLCKIVNRVRIRKHCGRLSGIAPINESAGVILSSFMRTGRLMSTRDQCLSSSVALIDHLARAHLYPDLVIGVRMKPFSAHAWVQKDDTVLNDNLDTVLPYTPILVV